MLKANYIECTVLPWNMVDKSPSPLQTDFEAVFGEETVQTGLLSPE